MQDYNYTNLYKATIISLFTAIIITGFSIIFGKENLFLKLNIDLGFIADYFFTYTTYLGDGIVWAIFCIVILIVDKRKFPIVILSIIISTIIVHVVKGQIFDHQPRPLEALPQFKNIIHTVPGVTIHLVGSFPSGHTTQAFTMYLLLCFFLNKKWILWVGYLIAILIGYSRIYQAQHFPIDVAGGIVAAIITIFLSINILKFIYKIFYTQKL